MPSHLGTGVRWEVSWRRHGGTDGGTAGPTESEGLPERRRGPRPVASSVHPACARGLEPHVSSLRARPADV